MKNVTNEQITPNQFMFMMTGSMIAVGVLSLPNAVVKIAAQHGWVSVFLGIVYPLYVVIMASIIQKSYPNSSIFAINKELYGNILGTACNIFFIVFFGIYLTSEIFAVTTVLRTTIVSFISPLKVYIVITFLAAYTVCKGLKVIGRVNQSIFFLTLFMSSLFIVGIIKGTPLNVMPLFKFSLWNVVKASKESVYQYAGVEICLITYGNISDKNANKKKLMLNAIFIVSAIYTWITFTTIYTLGINLVPHFTVATPAVVRFIEFPVINNFRFIFMVLWTLIIINLAANYYYAISMGIKSMFTSVSNKSICIAMIPLVIVLTTRYINEPIKQRFVNSAAPKLTIIMLTYITVTVVSSCFIKNRRGKVRE